ncbi:MAG: arylesterase [Alphaproteobacteria bacterium]|nr:MAG: arylesterase [Alphaproteobacteria bacterium]
MGLKALANERLFILAAILLAVALAGGLSAGPAMARQLTIVALGDSLVAGYGLADSQAFPARLQQALRARGHDVTVVNAGVSGDTSAGGLERLDWSVPEGADAVIVELGANDALRGLSPQATRRNIAAIVGRLKARGIAVLLAGMLAPPNMGADYADAFNAVFPDIARDHDVPLYPFFLDGVAANAELVQADGMHPTAAGIDEIVSRFLPSAERLIAQLTAQLDD